MSETSSVLSEAFDVDSEKGSSAFEPIPKGWYPASILDLRVAELKSKKGQAATAEWEIEGGDYANRRIFDRMILTHENLDAMRIGRQRFKDVCDACGVVGKVTDLTALHNKVCLISVGIEEDPNGQYAPKNRIKRVKKFDETKAAPKANGKDADPNDEIPF